MAIYAVWNNKGGVGKSYLTFQIACEYAQQHPDKKVLVVDMCPQANVSSMLLGGIEEGERLLGILHDTQVPRTISGYIASRLNSPYQTTNGGYQFLTQVSSLNKTIPENLYLVAGDEQLEIQSSGISYMARSQQTTDAWRLVHLWVKDLVSEIQYMWNGTDSTVFIDCNPSFSVYTELALAAADCLIIPFSADGSSKRAVRSVLSLVYGVVRRQGDRVSEFSSEMSRYRMQIPHLYMYVGNRLTTIHLASAKAFKTVVEEIGDEIYSVWQQHPEYFKLHPTGAGTPTSRRAFRQMFQYEVHDANTASVVSGALGIPIGKLTAGYKTVAGKNVQVSGTQLDRQVPNIRKLVACIE